MSKQAASPVSVVIPTWNAAPFVERALECLCEQAGVEFETVVVDNGVVNRETEEVCERFRGRLPTLRYLRFEKQLGYAGAVNEGTAAAKHDLVAVTNNDNLPAPHWLSQLVQCYESAPGSIVTANVHRPDFPDPFGARMNVWGRIVRVPRHGEYVPFHPDGSSFLFSRKTFGLPYDPDYFIYHEDVSLGWRAWLMGHEVRLCENAKASTFDGGSTRRIKYSTAYYTERNRWLNYFVFLSCASLGKLMPLFLLDAALKLLLGSNRRAKLHALAWIILHPGVILKKRRAVQKLRKRSDAEILPLLSFKYADGGIAARLNGFMRAYARMFGLT